jgi:hypothetical protein
VISVITTVLLFALVIETPGWALEGFPSDHLAGASHAPPTELIEEFAMFVGNQMLKLTKPTRLGAETTLLPKGRLMKAGELPRGTVGSFTMDS